MQFSTPIPSWTQFPKGTSQFAISQFFGENPEMYAQFNLLAHNGIDFAAPLDTPVAAVCDGWIVESTAKETGYGLRLCQRVEDNGKFYLLVYGHFHKVNYPDIPWNFSDKSRPVKRGEIIGFVDSTGNSTGNHLHLGLYEYDAFGNKLNSNNGYQGAIDPWPYFKNMTQEIDIRQVLSKDGHTIYLALGAPTPEVLNALKTILAAYGITPKPQINSKDL